jgi:hypothetical protein
MLQNTRQMLKGQGIDISGIERQLVELGVPIDSDADTGAQQNNKGFNREVNATFSLAGRQLSI